MLKDRIYPAQNATQSLGTLTINVFSEVGFSPIEGANVSVKLTGTNNNIIEELNTDISGQTIEIELPTPPLEYSLEPNSPKPYSEYTITANAPNFIETRVIGTQLLPTLTAIQTIQMENGLNVRSLQQDDIIISPHTLYKEYPPKIPESPIKEDLERDPIVLQETVIPEYIVVHDGAPDDQSAKNYYIQFKNYIKNVASSEIYSTWPYDAIQANILSILSFTLNRVYTEWYRNKGKNFTITSSTAYDQKFIYGRNIYKNISQIVDSIFVNYIAKPGIKQPLFAQYCDGFRVTCPTWLSQWGSKYLADTGTSTINILRNYYGSDIYLATATRVSGIPSSFPGYNLQQGSRGGPVRTIQEQINAISNNFPYIPKLRVDRIYGPKTKNAVSKFQEVFNLPPNGIVDYPTWYRISDIYVAVTRLAEL